MDPTDPESRPPTEELSAGDRAELHCEISQFSAQMEILGNFSGPDPQGPRHEDRIHRAMEALPAPMFIKDLEGVFVFANRSFQELSLKFRPNLGSIAGHRAVDLIGPEAAEVSDRKDRELIERGGTASFEVKVCPPDGSTHYFIIFKSLLCDLADRPEGIVGIIVEVSSLRKVQQDLRESRHRLELVFASADLGQWDHHLPSRVQVVDRRWAEMLGYTLEEIQPLLKRPHGLTHPDDVAKVEQAFADHLAGRTSYIEVEFRMRSRSGQWRWLLSRGRLVERDPSGRPLRVMGIHRDITGRKLVEQQLLERQRDLATAQEIGRTGSWSMDLKTHRVQWSDMMYRLLGLEPGVPADPDLETFISRVHPADRDRARAVVADAVREGRDSFEFELRTVPIDGRSRFIRGVVNIQRDSRGRPLRAIGMDQDVTESRLAQQGLQQRLWFEEAIRRFAQNLLDPESQPEGFLEGLETLCHAMDSRRLRIYELRADPDGRLAGRLRWRSGPAPMRGPQAGNDRPALQAFEDGLLESLRKRQVSRGQIECEDNDAGLCALLAVPIFLGEELWGLMTLLDEDPGRCWPQKTAEQLSTASSVLAGAIARRRAEDLAVLQSRLTQGLNNVSSLTQAMELCMDAAMQLPDVDGGGIYVYDDNDRLELTSHRGLPQPFVRAVSRPAQGSKLDRSVREGRPIWTTFSEWKHADVPWPEGSPLLAGAVIPVLHEGRAVACFNMISRHVPTFTAAARQGLLAVAGLVGSVVVRLQAQQALQRSEARYRGLVTSQTDLIVRVDPRGRFTFVNEAYCRAVGRSREELLDSSFQPIVHPEDLPGTMEAMEDLWKPPYRIQVEQRMWTPEGWLWVEWEDCAILDESGRIVEIQAVGRDVSQRKAFEEELRNANEKLHYIIDNSWDIIFQVDLEGRIVFANKAAERIIGYSLETLLSMSAIDLLLPEYRTPVVHRLRLRREGREVRQPLKVRIRRADGEAISLEMTTTPVTLRGRVIGVQAIARDITERERSERLIQAAHARLVDAREEERRRLARELHDSLGQELLGLQLSVQTLREGRRDEPADDPTGQRLVKIERRCRELIGEVRRISHGLYPPTLENLGLVAALEQLPANIGGQDRVDVWSQPELRQQRFDAKVEIALFRICQEAVANALRYGNVWITLTREDGVLALTVTDDGCGFDVDAASGGLGLIAMRERAEGIGAELSIDTDVDGTRVRVDVQLQPDPPAKDGADSRAP